MKLCESLIPIYDLEISLGNEVESIDSPAGTKCPHAVNFKNKLHFSEIEKQLSLSSSVEQWTNKDKHYPLQKGYFCNKYKHSVAGPL